MQKITVLAPSSSPIRLGHSMPLAKQRLEQMGYMVQYSEHLYENNEFYTSSIDSRVSDLHQAFKDEETDIILTAIGGFSVNQILPYLDYELIKQHPKPICGYSDITALLNAIYAKTGIVTYLGPHFSSFAMTKGLEYTIDGFEKATNQSIYTYQSSKQWSDDAWFQNQDHRHFYPSKWKVYHKGDMRGILIGGNLSTFHLLQGSEYMPSLKDKIILIEEDCEVSREYTVFEFDRHLESLIQCHDFCQIQGILIGRFQRNSFMNEKMLIKILDQKKALKNIPIMYDLDFGHTTPTMTLPIGGFVEVDCDKMSLTIKSK